MNKAEKNHTEDFFNYIDWKPRDNLSLLELRQLMKGFQKYLLKSINQENKELRGLLQRIRLEYKSELTSQMIWKIEQTLTQEKDE